MYILAFDLACGFVGRHLIDHLVTNHLVSFVRAVDKTPPQMAWMNTRHLELFNSESVEYCSANLIREGKNRLLLYAIL